MSSCTLISRFVARQKRPPLVTRTSQGVRQIHTRTLLTLSAALLLVVLGGCTVAPNECDATQPGYCDGDVAVNCGVTQDPDGHAWTRETCGAGTCKTDKDGAFCATASAPDPRCDGLYPRVCDGTTLVVCRSSYATSTYDCATHASTGAPVVNASTDQTFCVATFASASCNAEPPDPACERLLLYDSPVPACSGNDRVVCEAGVATSRQSCSGLFCKASGEGSVAVTICALSNDPDPACPPIALSTFCEGEAVVQCELGYRIQETSCPAGEACRAVLAGCAGAACTETSCAAP